MAAENKITRVCVYCASSAHADPLYYQHAYELGQILAREKITLVYGGGGIGSMGKLADGALSENGKVIGVIPHFMARLEWGHPRLTEMHTVDDMHGRKRLMLQNADAVIALPGGCGTLEELLEAITLKRLGLFLGPIILLNTRRFYDHLQTLMQACISERFMNEKHLTMWTIVETPDQVLPAIRAAKPWPKDARNFAAVTG